MGIDVAQFSQPKLQKPAHQHPRTTSHAVTPPSGALLPVTAGRVIFSMSLNGGASVDSFAPSRLQEVVFSVFVDGAFVGSKSILPSPDDDWVLRMGPDMVLVGIRCIAMETAHFL